MNKIILKHLLWVKTETNTFTFDSSSVPSFTAFWSTFDALSTTGTRIKPETKYKKV